MKKYMIIILLIFSLVGCTTNNIPEASYSLNKDYYDVYVPYKKGVVNNYIAYNVKNKYDLKEVETGLFRISSNYFSNSKYYYQEGQYLTKDMLKELLDKEYLNKADNIVVDGVNIQPTYISYIHEQNYLNSEGKLQGISLAMVLNPYQNNKKIEDKIVLDFGKSKINELLEYVRGISGLENVDIVIGLYLENNFTSLMPGNYKLEGKTNSNKLNSLNNVDEKHYLLSSNELRGLDLDVYNNFLDLEGDINDYLGTFTSVSGTGLYINNRLVEINMNVYANAASRGEIIALAQEVAKKIATNFDSKVYTQVEIQSDFEVEALIIRTEGVYNPKIYILD